MTTQEKVKASIGEYLLIIKTDAAGTEYFFYGKVVHIDEEGDYRVVDQDGDYDTWLSDIVAKADKEIVEQQYIIFPFITPGYNGVVNREKKLLIVGCQEIPFEQVQRIAELCK